MRSLRYIACAGVAIVCSGAPNYRPAVAATAHAPLSFERLTSGGSQWIARGNGYQVAIGSAAVKVGIGGEELTISLVGSKANTPSSGLDRLPGKVNFFIGSDPKRWLHDIPTYSRVRYSGVYSGVDAVWYGNQGQLEYDLDLKPGADPGQIRMRFEGAKKLSIDKNGDLRVQMQLGSLSLRLPEIYQQQGGRRRRIAGSYDIRNGREVRFRLAAYDNKKRLVIDPTLVYGSYFGSGSPQVQAIAVDTAGNVYVGGNAFSYSLLPTLNGVQPAMTGNSENSFISKFDPTGKTLLFSTYLGGSGTDDLLGMAVDSSGNVVATGTTSSNDFPIANPMDSKFGGSFAFKINTTGNGLVYSTFLDGASYPSSVAIDAAGSAYFTGWGTEVASTPGALTAIGESGQIFAIKLAPTGSAVYIATIGGGTGNAIAVDSQGAAYIAGQIGYQGRISVDSFSASRVNGSGQNAFLAKLSPDASSLTWAARLGGSVSESATAITLGADNSVYVGGNTTSPDLPVTANALQLSYGGNGDAFLASLSADGTSFGFVTYLGGSASDTLTSLSVNQNSLILAGNTFSNDFPTQNALQPAFPGSPHSFFKSANAGQSFSAADAGLTGFSNATLLPDPSTPGTIVLATSAGIYRSTDDGQTWTKVLQNADGNATRSLSNPSVLYSVNYGQVSKSSDGGQTWSTVFSATDSTILVVSPDDPNTVLGFYGNMQYISTDGGETFPAGSIVPFTLQVWQNSSVIASPDGSLYAATGLGDVYKSSDTGATWTRLQTGIVPGAYSGFFTTGFAYAPSAPSTLYASDGTNVYKSPDAGVTWSETGPGAAVGLIAVSPSSPSIVYGASTLGFGVLVSNDGGATWASAGPVIDANDIDGLAIDSTNPSELYLTNTSGETGFVAKVATDGSALNWSTFYGSYGAFTLGGAAPTSSGNVWLAGSVSGSLPVTPDARNGNSFVNNAVALAEIADVTAACSYTIDPSSGYAYALTAISFAITAPSGCVWTATPSDSSWIHLVRSSGTGSGTVPFLVDANETSSTRTGNVSVAGQVFTITEPAAICAYQVSSPSIDASGGTATITVSSPAGCAWNVEFPSNDPAQITSSATGTGDGSVTISIPPNLGISTLPYAVSVAGRKVTVDEGAVCGFLFPEGTDLLLASAAAPLSILITANQSSCSWNASSDQGWLTLSNPATTGSGNLNYSVTANTSTSARTAHISVGTQQLTVTQSGSGLVFVPITPCRIADTRKLNGQFGAPSLIAGASRDFEIQSSSCGIPTGAAAYALNVTAVPQGSLSYITVWPSGQTQPLASTLNSLDGRIKADAAIVPAGNNGAISVYATNATDLVLDINGYFIPVTDPSAASALQFYPLPPCRIADTRKAAAPSLVSGTSRTFAIANACGVPSNAQAYSLNFTVVPQGSLYYLSVYPTGTARPVVSTLNALTGTITANAAIVPAGTNGSIDAYAAGNTDLIIDVNGYFAPANSGGLSLYNLSPCRVLDTRKQGGDQPLVNEELDVDVQATGCGAPSTAQAYVFNATVVPQGTLGYLTLWPQGGTQPVVSTLNALDGAIASNMAILPTTNGSISAFSSGTAQLVLDISGYFAP